MDDVYNPLGRVYVWLSNMGSSSSKEPEKSTEVGPPTKQMKDSPTINAQGGLHLFSMTGSTTGTVVAGFLFVLLMCVGYRLFQSYKIKTRDARVKIVSSIQFELGVRRALLLVLRQTADFALSLAGLGQPAFSTPKTVLSFSHPLGWPGDISLGVLHS